MQYSLILIPNLLLLIDWAQHRREIHWFAILARFGPIGAVAYTAYFWDSITFPARPSRVQSFLRRKRAQRCQRCSAVSKSVEAYFDGKCYSSICGTCREEMDRVARGSLRSS